MKLKKRNHQNVKMRECVEELKFGEDKVKIVEVMWQCNDQVKMYSWWLWMNVKVEKKSVEKKSDGGW